PKFQKTIPRAPLLRPVRRPKKPLFGPRTIATVKTRKTSSVNRLLKLTRNFTNKRSAQPNSKRNSRFFEPMLTLF
ncbi:hypothetical protein PspLS_09422, partial [Pyricularia sp. CBS 133598]